jgi:hypothetical protein
MASLNEYLSGYSVPGPNADELESLVKSLRSYRKNQNVGSALGVETDTSPTPGIVSKLFDPQTGLITSGGRGIRAGVFDLLGVDHPSLKLRNPLESALDAFTGEFEIGTGDIPGLKVKADDSFLTRAAKMGGAFVGDVVTDPISYVGGSGAIGKAGASKIAVKRGNDILEAATKSGVDEGKLIDSLIARTPAGQVAKAQREAIDAKKITKEELGTGSQLDLFDAKSPRRKKIAATELGNIVGSAVLARGRKGVVDDLTDILGSRDVAVRVFDTLPDVVKGGTFLVNPLTGAPKVRLTSGRGEWLGPVGSAVNRMRFGASRTLVGGAVTRQLSGQSGRDLQAAKQAISKAGRKAPTDMASARLSDWVTYSDGLRSRGADFTRLSAPWMSAIGQSFRAQQNASPEVQEAFRLAFFQPWQAQDLSNPQIAGAVEQATQLRGAMREAWEERGKVGLDIGDLGPQWSPLRVTKEEADRQAAASRTGSFDDAYRTERGRNSLVQPVLDATEGQRGFRVPGREGIEYADAITANELLGRNAYSTDPIQVATEYLQEAANAVATQRFVTAMTEAGVLIRDIPESVFALRGPKAAALQGAASRFGQAAVRKTAEAQAAAEQNLRTTVENGGRYQEQFLRLRSEAQDRFMVASDELAVAEREAAEAVKRLRAAEPKTARVREKLRTYAQTGLEGSVSDSERLSRNAAARTSRANDRTSEFAEEAARLRGESFDVPNREYDMTVGPVETAAQQSFERFDEAASELAQLRVEVAALRSNRDGVLDDLSKQQVREVNEYWFASENYLASRERLSAARAGAKAAKRELDEVSDLPAVQALTTVDGVVSAYTTRLFVAKRELEVVERAIKTLEAQTSKLEGVISQARKDGNMAQVRASNARLGELKKQLDEQTDKLNSITGEVKAAEDAIEQAISGGLKLGGPAKEYAEAVIVAANKLSEVQFQALKVVGSETRVREAIEAIGKAGGDDAVVSAAIKDLVDNYLIVTKALGKQDMKKFSKADRKIMREVSSIGDVALDEARQGFTGRVAADGGRRAGRGKFRDLYATHSMQESLERMFLAATSKTEAQRILQDYVGPYTLLWRLSATQLRGPGYTFLNATGAGYNNYLGGVTAKETAIATGVTWKLVKAMRSSRKGTPGITAAEQFREVEKVIIREIGDATYGGMSVAKMTKDLMESGGFEATQTFEAIQEISKLGGAAEAAMLSRAGSARYAFTQQPTSVAGRASQATVNTILTNRFTRFINDSNQSVEVAARLAAYMHGMKKFGDHDLAMDFMYMLHFDYSDLAPLEKWTRVFVPFYTWSRKNIPLQLRSLVLQPSKVSKALYLMDAAEGSFGVQGDDAWINEVLPEYVQNSGGFATMFDFNGNQITYLSNLPSQDLNKLVQAGGPIPIRGRELANMIGPIGGLYGVLTGVDTSTGRRFDPAGTPAPAYLRGLDAVTGGKLLAKDRQGKALAPEGLVQAVTEVLPPLGVIERLASGLGSAGVPLVDNLAPETAKDRGRTNLLNVSGLAALLGGSTSTMTPRTLRGELGRRQEKQKAILDDAAARAGVDVQWVRDRLSEGLTPEEVALLIARGQGTPDRSDPIPRRLNRREGQEIREALLRMQ